MSIHTSSLATLKTFLQQRLTLTFGDARSRLFSTLNADFCTASH